MILQTLHVSLQLLDFTPVDERITQLPQFEAETEKSNGQSSDAEDRVSVRPKTIPVETLLEFGLGDAQVLPGKAQERTRLLLRGHFVHQLLFHLADLRLLFGQHRCHFGAAGSGRVYRGLETVSSGEQDFFLRVLLF